MTPEELARYLVWREGAGSRACGRSWDVELAVRVPPLAAALPPDSPQAHPDA